jgi:hypothetical protein
MTKYENMTKCETIQYNLKYLLSIADKDELYEQNAIMNNVDRHISGIKTSSVFHLVPIIYSLTFFSGLSVFIYKLMV